MKKQYFWLKVSEKKIFEKIVSWQTSFVMSMYKVKCWTLSFFLKNEFTNIGTRGLWKRFSRRHNSHEIPPRIRGFPQFLFQENWLFCEFDDFEFPIVFVPIMYSCLIQSTFLNFYLRPHCHYVWHYYFSKKGKQNLNSLKRFIFAWFLSSLINSIFLMKFGELGFTNFPILFLFIGGTSTILQYFEFGNLGLLYCGKLIYRSNVWLRINIGFWNG